MIRAVVDGSSARAAAARFDVSAASAIRWVSEWRRNGQDAAHPRGKKPNHGSKLDPHAAFTLRQIEARSDLTLAEIAERLKDERDVCTNVATVCRFLAWQAITLKKTAHAAEQQRAGVKRSRQMWFDLQPILDPKRLMFIDETATSTATARAYGRAERGARCEAGVPRGHWCTTTFVGGLRYDGIAAPLVVDGTMNGALFRAYTEQMLAPALGPGGIVIMDNLPAHKATGVWEAIEGVGAWLFYLPPYLPDLNPIEMASAKLKPRCGTVLPAHSTN